MSIVLLASGRLGNCSYIESCGLEALGDGIGISLGR
jgi:hypothetical protein